MSHRVTTPRGYGLPQVAEFTVQGWYGFWWRAMLASVQVAWCSLYNPWMPARYPDVRSVDRLLPPR